MKNQFKKSVSLFLAVLMVLSCWVWFVAPEEAKVEAADGQYYVKLYVNVETYSEKVSNPKMTVYYKTKNGTGEDKSVTQSPATSLFSTTGNDRLMFEGWVDGFPTSANFYCYLNKKTGGTTLRVGYFRMYVGKDAASCTNLIAGNRSKDSMQKKASLVDGDQELNFSITTGYCTNNTDDYTEKYPTVNETKNLATTTLNCPEFGSTAVNATTAVNVAKYDQYGVKWIATDYEAKVAETENGDGIDGTLKDNGLEIVKNGDTFSVKISAKFQELFSASNTGEKALYLIVSQKGRYDNEVAVSKQIITVKYTPLKYEFNADGSVNGLGAVIKDSNGNMLDTTKYDATGYYGKPVTAPTNESVSAGSNYVFLGFWTKPQPTDSNNPAYYYSLKTDFAYPTTSTEFAGISGEADANGIKIDSSGRKRYDAGERWNPEEDRVYTDNKIFYGWWFTEDVSVKFYDVDGKFLSEQTIKSGQGVKAIEWPKSEYLDKVYTSGAFSYTVDKTTWTNYDGTALPVNGVLVDEDGNKYNFVFDAGKTYIFTPKINKGSFKDSYTVNFANPNKDEFLPGQSEYGYRAQVTPKANPGIPTAIINDLQFSYEFLGWSNIEPTTGANYHVLLEDADFDVKGIAITLNKDWVVRNDVTYYAVYRRYIKTYVVEFSYTNAAGVNERTQVKVAYGDVLVPPTDVVPLSYVLMGYGQKFDKWRYNVLVDGATTTVYSEYDDSITFTSENIRILAAALDDGINVSPVVITATYGAREATENTITFNYFDDDGNTVTKTAKVKYREYILYETVEELIPAEKWDDGESLYTFTGQWQIVEGAGSSVYDDSYGVDSTLDTDDLVDFTPTSNVTFKAVYDNPVPFYTVTYIDGANTWSERVLQGSNVPAWMANENEEYIPADYRGEGGTYEFQGWYDADGNKVTTADLVTGNLTLYAQFKFVPDTYTITFMNHDGSTQLAAGQYQKGHNIEALVTEATRGAQMRPDDETYEYEFIGWDKAVPTFCEGYNVTYTALYKTTYKYYDVKWYNSKLVDGVWVADKETENVDGKDVEKYLLATTHHTYNSKLYTPSVSFECKETAPAGRNYVFAGWYYNDAAGNAVKYERGIVVTEEMEFYAKYTLTDKYYTVTTVVGDNSATYSVADGKAAEVDDPFDGYVDAANHNKFIGWYTDDTYDNEYVVEYDSEGNLINGAITEDTTLYAKFEVSPHDFSNTEITEAATYYAQGKEVSWCSCNREKTETETALDMIEDTTAPTGTIYLGGKSWSSTDEQGANATDGDDISIFVNGNSNVVITAKDTGIGVKVIRAFAFPANTVLTAENFGAAQELATDVYFDDSEIITTTANFSVKLSDFVVADLNESGEVQYDSEGKIKHKALEDGEAYIIYYYVNDKATENNGAAATGNQLNRKVRTAKFIYDNSAPEFAVDGVSNDAPIPTYCGAVTIEDLEKGITLKVNDTPVEIVYEDGAEKGTYTINYSEGMDNITIAATDKAGNTFTKKIKIANHIIATDIKPSTCDDTGYYLEKCTICGHVQKELEYIAVGHVMGTPGVIPATCTENGYEVVACELCDYTITNVYKKDAAGDLTDEYLYPAHDHAFPSDYTVVTESTCKTYGTEEAVCIYCKGELEEGKLVRPLTELDADNHEEELTIEHLDATCILDGYHREYYACCNKEIKDEILTATGHGNLDAGTAEWYIFTEPTCYQAGMQKLQCLWCTAYITDEVVIPATGDHVKVVANPDTYKEDGYVAYKCATEGCPEKYENKILVDETLESYRVKFLAEDGEEVLYEAVVLEGDYVKKNAVTAPEKAATKEARYTFEGWKDAKGNIYKLPLEVKSEMTLTASYKETKIKYTHIFKVPTTWTETLAADDNYKVVDTLIGVIGDVRVPSDTPVFTHKVANIDAQLKKLYTFEFKGWKNSAGEIVEDFTVADNAVFTAEFEAVPREYRVLFYIKTDLVIFETTVKAGAAAYSIDAENNIVYKNAAGEIVTLEITKGYDENNHYAFAGWYTDAALTNEYDATTGAITAETKLYAKFTATAHSYELNTAVGTVVPGSDPEVKDGIVQKADCLNPEMKEFICACGHTKQVETENSILGHDFAKDTNGNVIYTYDSVTGKEYTSECSRCGIKESRDVSNATIKFVSDDGSVRYVVKVGDTVSYAKYDDDGKLIVPTKDADAENTYTFIGWKNADGTDSEIYDIDHVFTVVSDKDVIYNAEFEATKRSYVVKYVVYDSLVAKFTVEYGKPIPAYTDETDGFADKSDRNGHDVFAGWSVVADGKATVTGDLSIIAKFVQADHVYESQGKTEATCISGAGEKFKCTVCGYEAVKEDSSARGDHKWDTIETQEPNFSTQTDGYVIKKCTVCNETKKETISGKTRTAKVTVKDVNGAVVEGATVTLYKDGEPYAVQTTITGGATVFTGIADGSYTVFVKYPDGTTITSDMVITVKGEIVKNGDITVAPKKVVEEEDTSCKCACHKDTFWGIIYRLFQKIIAMFTGKANCCACPDGRI